MDEPLEQAYFNWLLAKVTDVQQRVAAHWALAAELHNTEFVWLVPGDDLRAMDGIELRDFFCNEFGIERDPTWYNMQCSVLEMLIGLAIRAEFQTEIPVREWFWRFVENLGLTDGFRPLFPQEIYDVLYTFMWRMYRPDGSEGGLFPIRNSNKDQRKEEIWHQFCDYIAEEHLF